MLKKIFAVTFLTALIFVGSQNNFAKAQDVYVGTSNATGWDCYIMSETVHYLDEYSGISQATLKMVTQNGNVRFLEYKFWYDNGVHFSNSQGFKGIADARNTPIEWKMWQVILKILV